MGIGAGSVGGRHPAATSRPHRNAVSHGHLHRAFGRRAGSRPLAVVSLIEHLREAGTPVNDAGAEPYRERAGSVRDVVALLAPDLADDEALIKAINEAVS